MIMEVEITDKETGAQNMALVTFTTIGDKSAASVSFRDPPTEAQEELVADLIPGIVRAVLGVKLTQEGSHRAVNDREAGELQRKWFGGGQG